MKKYYAVTLVSKLYEIETPDQTSVKRLKDIAYSIADNEPNLDPIGENNVLWILDEDNNIVT